MLLGESVTSAAVWRSGLCDVGAALPQTASVTAGGDGANDRYADDIHINREMREVERWNDPAAEFLTVSPIPFPLMVPLGSNEKMVFEEKIIGCDRCGEIPELI